MMNYLRKRGWVVFYLEKQHRECKDMCWLKLYQQEEDKESNEIKLDNVKDID